MTHEELVDKYAQAWRELDASIIEPYLDESFTYSSFYVFQTLDKKGYLSYLGGKFAAIKDTNCAPAVSTDIDRNGNPCVILHQCTNEPVCIFVKFNGDYISEGYMMPISFK